MSPEAWKAELRTNIRGAMVVPSPEEWAEKPRQRREVFPDGTDTAALDRILADKKLRNKVRVLAIRCPRDQDHRLADVLLVAGEHIYVADADSDVDDISVLDHEGLRTERWSHWGRRRVEHIEYLDRLTPDVIFDSDEPVDIPLAKALAIVRLPARCVECDGPGGSVEIPATWVFEQLSAGATWVPWSGP